MSHSQYESTGTLLNLGLIENRMPQNRSSHQKHFGGVVPDWSGRMYATGVVPHRCHRAACWCCHLSPRLRTGSYWASEEVVLQGGAVAQHVGTVTLTWCVLTYWSCWEMATAPSISRVDINPLCLESPMMVGWLCHSWYRICWPWHMELLANNIKLQKLHWHTCLLMPVTSYLNLEQKSTRQVLFSLSRLLERQGGDCDISWWLDPCQNAPCYTLISG